MKLINVDETLINDFNDDVHFWYYNPKIKDFFVQKPNMCNTIRGNVYVIEVDGVQTRIPEYMHIIIGDYTTYCDSIKLSEISGRPFDLHVFNRDMSETMWSLVPLKIVGYEENYDIDVPRINKPFPIGVGKDKAILVHCNDMFSDIKELELCT